MRTDSELRSEFRSALEAVTPPAPWLAHAVKKGLGTKAPTRRSYRAPLQLRFGLNVVAILVLIGLALAAVGVYLTVHQAVAPAAHPTVGRVFFPDKMVTASTGWSWVDPELWRTTDGGANWTDVSPSLSRSAQLRSETGTFYLLDATHAWVAQSSQGATGGLYITTFRTTDGGKTWHEGASIGGVSPKLFFIDENHGWLLMPPQGSSPADSLATLYSTDDAGLHWNFTSSAPWTGWNNVGSGTMTFSSLTTGWISAADGSLQVTHDGGVTWHVQALPITLNAGGNIGEPRFFDPQHGLITWAGSASPVVLLVTSDGGSSWSVRSLPGPTGIGLDFADANHGWAIAYPANLFEPPAAAVALPLYKTDDGGLTWVRVLTNILLRSPEGVIGPVHFVDRNNGFMVRRANQSNDPPALSQLLKTTDGGRTWTVVVEAPQTPYRATGS